ncbi:putative inorganic phosphate cotransporter [Ostrinia nubilalis]|uniref:putative inorganic phosphate cotransporter n=1 Tax=Ostrinia nubilalis TaxID=29057 RepID=UPI0030822479
MAAEKVKQCEHVTKVMGDKTYGFGIRHLQVASMTLVVIALMGARASMGVAVLAMSDESRRNDTGIEIYEWDKKTQSVILSSFFWGYVLMQVPAGILANNFGGKPILLFALLANMTICTLVPTLAAVGGWMLVCACRMGMGLSQACLFPASQALLGQWLPENERTSYTGVVMGGIQLGTVIAMPICGLLAETALGWKMIFYAFAGFLFIVSAIWYWSSANSPREHRMISEEERRYIEALLNVSENKKPPTPWRHILRSLPMWVLLAPHFGFVASFSMFFVDTPTFMEKGLKISLKNSALLSALPYVGMWVGTIFSSLLSEKLINKGLLSITAARKVFQSLALGGAAAGLVVLGYLDVDSKALAIMVLISIMTMCGFTSAGVIVNELDLSPNYAGVIVALLNFLANFASILMPIATGYILNNDPSDLTRWRIVFLIMAAISVAMLVIHVLFGTSERQEWDDPNFLNKENADPEEMKPVLTDDEKQEMKLKPLDARK